LICSTCFAPKCRCRKLWRTDLASRTTPLGYRLLRNVGGRVNPALLETLGILRAVTKGAGGNLGIDSNLIVLHHTDCGIKHCYRHAPGLLSKHMGVETKELDGALPINDPYAAVAHDVSALKANPQLPGGYIVSGLVYDVATGKVEIVVPPSRLRREAAPGQ
jgi:carbonic anhydrase